MPILPVKAYTSPDWFQLEQEHLFSNTWQFAGFVEDLKDPGDYLTVQCGLQNILVVKGSDQQLRAFHNLCRHRGTQLLRAVGKKQQAITCPYHDWTYNLTGQLISVPEKEKEFPDLEVKKICLHKASVGEWRGMLWVHPDPEAVSLKEWFGPIEPYLGPHEVSRLIEYPKTRYEKVIHANWKIVTENFLDVYHLAHLHAGTLNMYDHKKAEYGYVGPQYYFKEPLVPKFQENLDKLMPFKRIAEVTDDKLAAYVAWLFPNMGITEAESSWSTFQVVPLTVDTTKVIVRTKLEPTTIWAFTLQAGKSFRNWKKLIGFKTKYGKKPDKNSSDPLDWGDLMEEDIFACEQQQKSLSNPLFAVKNTAKDAEMPVREFQRLVQEWIIDKQSSGQHQLQEESCQSI